MKRVLHSNTFLMFCACCQILYGLGCLGVIGGFTNTSTIVSKVFGVIWLFFGITTFVSLCDSAARRLGLLPPKTMADVERLIREGKRISAISCYREIHQVGLAEAKKAIDDLYPAT